MAVWWWRRVDLQTKRIVSGQWGPAISRNRIQKLKIIRMNCVGRVGERESGLVKGHMTGDNNPVGGEVKAAVSLMMRRVASENAKSGAWRKFICGNDSEVRITGTTKDTKVII
jgi:hypothetical protein